MNIIYTATLFLLGLFLVPGTEDSNYVQDPQEAEPVVWEISLEIDQVKIDRIIPPFGHFQICGTVQVRMHTLLEGMEWTPPAPEKKYWVYTDSGAYLFHDLETALSFSKSDEVVMSEDGTVYGGEPEIGNLKIVECIAENSTFESDRPLMLVQKSVQEVVLW